MNRRQRREAAKTSSSQASSSPQPSTAEDIPLARPPPPTPRKSRTLYEIAAEKQDELSHHGKPFKKTTTPGQLKTKEIFLRPDGSLSDTPPLTASPATYTSTSTYPVSSSVDDLKENSTKIDLSESSLFDTLFTAITLSILHFTLSLLAAHQYAQSIPYSTLLLQSLFLAFPILTFLIHLAHGCIIHIPYITPSKPPPSSPSPPRSSSSQHQNQHQSPLALQAIFLAVATVSGCRLIALTNDAGYYAVMKKAPPIGVLWVWSVIELGLAGAVAGVIGPGLYAWWWEYGLW